MKTKLLLILFLVGSVSFAQNWSQVGATQFTDFASDASLDFDNSGVLYLAYINPIASSKTYVKTFDGTNWIDLTIPEVSTESASNVVIKINPVTNEPWVAYRRTTDNKFDAYRFDGTNWIAVTTAEGTGDLLDMKLQMQFNTSGNARIAGQYNIKGIHFYTQTTGIWTVNNFAPTGGSITQATVDFVNYNQYFYQNDNFGASYYGKNNIGGSSIFTKGLSSRNFREVSGISDENIVAANNLSAYNGAIWFADAGTSKGRPINTNGSKIGYLKLGKSITDSNYYIMFADSNDDLIFQKFKNVVSQWSVLPSVGINTAAADFFANMAMNPIDGNMYLFYLDGAKVSVKKYSIPIEVPKPTLFVDANATGNNDGTSFTDAYTSLQDALTNIEPVTTEIWVKAGRYTPSVSNRSSSFVFDKDGLSIYGGFDGTESSISERDIVNNPTILSGDLENDGNIGANLFDNSYHVTKINADDVLIDGFIISDGACTETTGANSRGSAIDKADGATNFTLRNTSIFDNYGTIASGIYTNFTNSGYLNIENCEFDDNDSRYGTGLYVLAGNNATLEVNITNTLFINNRSRNFGSAGYTGSGTWIRANGANSNLTTTITNCTFANNLDIGTQSGSERGPLALGRRTDGNSTHNATINNSIFYLNDGASSATTLAVNRGHTTAPNLTIVNNSIDEDNFSNLTFLTNTSNADPLFTDAVNDDFTLQTGSPAIDTGDNSKIPAGITTDILGHQRIFNTTVDMGAYEFGSMALGTDDFDVAENEIKLYPNPVFNTLNIETYDLNISEIQVYDMLGKQIIKTTSKTIDVSNLKQGIYLLKASTISGDIVKRFIKQ